MTVIITNKLAGFLMGSPEGPTLANIVMTEFENVTIKTLFNTCTTIFYKRYVENTILVS